MVTGWSQAAQLNSRSVLAVGACLLPLMFGCPQQSGEFRELGSKDDVTNTTPDDHHHHDHGPNGGHIVELGEHHGEVAIADGRILTLYILGGDAKTPAPVADATAKVNVTVGAEKKEVALTAAPLDGEADGKTSRFTAAADALPVEIVDIEDLQGDVVLVVAGKETVGKIEHHDDHDHDHDHDHKAEEKK